MSVTAARLGSSPVTVDWSELVRVPAGTGPAARPFVPDREEFSHAWDTLRARFSSGEVGFYDAPLEDRLSHASAAKDLAAQVLASGKFRDCLFLGIGGSSLGPACLLSALEHRGGRQIRFHFKDNPDPVDWKATLGSLSPESTLVCAVTKSGSGTQSWLRPKRQQGLLPQSTARWQRFSPCPKSSNACARWDSRAQSAHPTK